MREIHRFVCAEKAGANPGKQVSTSTKALCRALGISRSGFYAAQTAAARPPKAARERAALDAEVRNAFEAAKGRYGSRRVRATLKAATPASSRSSVARSMRRLGLCSNRPRPYRVTTDSSHRRPVAPNLLQRDFRPAGPNKAWCGDITYVHTQQGWLYLATVIDLWSRRVVGFATSQLIDRHLVIGALSTAAGQRNCPKGLIFHSDRGAQYASADFVAELRRNGITQSMSRAGDCWDNAPAESFFSTLKLEGLAPSYATRDAAVDAIETYITWYNAHRAHSTLGYLSPMTYEAQHRRRAA